MISMTDHLVALSKSGQQKPSSSSSMPLDLGEHERGPLSYNMLAKMKCSGIENTYIDARSRGGLVTPCKDLVEIVEIVEVIF